MDYKHKTKTENGMCQGFKNRDANGHEEILRGNSTIDGNICVLGTEKDYCRDEGGTCKNVSHYFKEFENPRWKNLLEKDSNDNSYRKYRKGEKSPYTQTIRTSDSI
jgi:hypothetical protein